MIATQSLFAGLIDYAGLYPPAHLEMRAAVRNYLAYRNGNRCAMLGRFIADVTRFDELCEAAGDRLEQVRLSVIAPADELSLIEQARSEGFRIECVETKVADGASVARIVDALPAGVECYCEIPIASAPSATLDALKAFGLRAKLRMGGVTPEAFPAAGAVVSMLQDLIERDIPFKATAGLHHPVRSLHKLTYASDSISGVMHGFLNLLAAAALLRNGGAAADAVRALEEQHAHAFRISEDELGWRDFAWTSEQVASLRRDCFVNFGSCSFAEPIADLEALGWL